mmetsp:Transcript_10452/g.34369  ORF Transcript_10452/g.34369 Transcript_10452/m.34369 type:complete len:113 (+) Transcript_10452:1972-2310(+)
MRAPPKRNIPQSEYIFFPGSRGSSTSASKPATNLSRSSNSSSTSAKAFDVLERLDPSPEYWERKRGACSGVFQMIIAGKENDSLRDVLSMLRNTSSPQTEYLIRTMKRYAGM